MSNKETYAVRPPFCSHTQNAQFNPSPPPSPPPPVNRFSSFLFVFLVHSQHRHSGVLTNKLTDSCVCALSVPVSVSVSLCLSVSLCVSFPLSVSVYVCLYVYLSITLSVCLSACLSVSVSVSVSLSFSVAQFCSPSLLTNLPQRNCSKRQTRYHTITRYPTNFDYAFCWWYCSPV